MATQKITTSSSLSIEVQTGTDKSGDAIFSKKTFSGVKPDATADNCFAVAEAIKEVMGCACRNYYVNDSAKLLNA
ncbi:DUF1659 domain-containing protein [Clostridium uliginosum]|uniref:DUF1659 domain-containing protein n=1 Tax=Clostridium uliginosum TaxID=119641 RepID=A0A1I1NNY6_9CLOT|nr:DUF1659 domain-containing protein [Clostridium uliginosum]SFC99002.1 Protein of unknown function [Clostridium uliginosum]